MSKKYIGLLLTFGLGAAFLFSAKSAKALEASLISITPQAQDISDQITPEGAPENIVLFGFVTTIDQAYTATFSASECPVMVVTPGGDIAEDNRWSCDTDTKVVTVPFTSKEIKGDMKDLPEGSTLSMIALVPAVAQGEDGPPEEMRGAWMSTNIQQWELIPPSQETPAFGYKLTGPSGEAGLFHMFIPDAIVQLLSEFSGEELTIEDLAVFNGDDQASLAITEVEGGAYVDINVTFASDTTELTGEGSSSVTKQITVKEQKDISLSAKDTEVKQGEKATLYGWVKDAKEGEKVMILRKIKGQKKFSSFGTVKIKKDGYFSKTFKATKTATFLAKYKKTKSSEEKITVTSKTKGVRN